MKSRQVFTLLLVLLFSYNPICAKNKKLDSLLNKLNISRPDTTKVKVLIQLSKEMRGVNSEQGNSYAQQALSLSENLDYASGKGDSYYFLASYAHEAKKYQEAISLLNSSIAAHYLALSIKNVIHSYYELGSIQESLNNLDSALYFYQVALDLSDSVDNELLIANSNFYLAEKLHYKGKNKLALAYALKAHNYYSSKNLEDDDWYTLNILSNIHSDMGLYAESLKYNLMALEISQKNGDKNGEVVIQNNTAILYQLMQNEELSNKNYQEAYIIAKLVGDMNMEATILGNLAGLKAELGDTITALMYTKKALSIQLENGFTCDLPYSYEGLGDMFIGQNVLDSAVYYLEKALEIAVTCEDLIIEISLIRNLGIVYRKQQKFDISEKRLQESLLLSKNAQMKYEERVSAFELYTLYKTLKDDKKALEYHEYFQSLSDSIYNLENSERVNKLTSEFEFKNEKILIELESEKRILANEAQLENQTILRNAALMMLFFTMIFLIMVYQSYLFIKLQNIKLKTLNDEKNTLIGIVAHDLRNPINNIKSIIPLLKDESPEARDSIDELVDMIGETTERMSGMIESILDVNAVEEMKVKLNLEVLNLGELVNAVKRSFQISADRKKIKISYDHKEEKHFAKLDKNYLIQILENLISNAIKFSPVNSHINISVLAANGFEEIAIQDEGPGISEKEQERLFQKYSKLSNAPTAGESSTGLGLSIVKKYVDAMDGKIICKSKLGEGSSFKVIFKSATKS